MQPPRPHQSQPQRPQQEQQEDQQQQQQQQQNHHADHYIHRKLEIFRTTEEECLKEFGVVPGSKVKSSSHTKSERREHVRGNSENTFVLNSDDEIRNLTDSQKKTFEGNGTRKRNSAQTGDESRTLTFLRLLRDPLNFITNVQRQYDGRLCFATPVRAASRENVAKLSDWVLTAGEFTDRYEFVRGGKCGKVPDVDESTASQSHCTEDETITSASYFDKKYSHLIETTPPMLLFDVHRVAVSERETDTILALAKIRQKAYDAREKCNGGQRGNRTPRSGPSDHRVTVVKKTSPRNSTGSSSKKSNDRTSPTKGGSSKEDCDFTPERTSSSMSSTSQDGEQDSPRRYQQPQENFRKPDVVHFERYE